MAAPLLAGVLSPVIGMRGVYVALLAVTAVGAARLWRNARDPAARERPRRAPGAARAAWNRQVRVARRSDA
jgi:hypothetical protein